MVSHEWVSKEGVSHRLTFEKLQKIEYSQIGRIWKHCSEFYKNICNVHKCCKPYTSEKLEMLKHEWFEIKKLIKGFDAYEKLSPEKTIKLIYNWINKNEGY